MQTQANITPAAPSQRRTYRLSFSKQYILFAAMWLLMMASMLFDPTMTFLDVLVGLPIGLGMFALFVYVITRPIAMAADEAGIWPGNPKRRRVRLIRWEDILTVKPRRMLHLRFLRLTVQGRLDVVWLPLDIRERAAFEQDMLLLAPDDNPLRRCIETGGAPQSRTAESIALNNSARMDVPSDDSLSISDVPDSNTPAEVAVVEAQRRLVQDTRLKSGANWFFWIAGMSLVNTLAMLLGINWAFVMGLGITQFIDGIAYIVVQELHNAWMVQAIAIVLDIAIAGVFVLFGIFARKQHRWAFIVGLILYALDILLVAFASDWLSAAFHVFALWGIFSGLRTLQKK